VSFTRTTCSPFDNTMFRYVLVDENGANGPVGTAIILLFGKIDEVGVVLSKSAPIAGDENAANPVPINCTNFRRLV
jgi:hypothetical protein